MKMKSMRKKFSDIWEICKNFDKTFIFELW